ncbi:hypothetical protein H4R33_003139 [Dimargaris cristalligena]|nr:hypothetical protein H4R33_003139 [Dimargaris cristalligena]
MRRCSNSNVVKGQAYNYLQTTPRHSHLDFNPYGKGLLSALALTLATIGTLNMAHANPATTEDHASHQPHLQKRFFRSNAARLGAIVTGGAVGSLVGPVGTVVGAGAGLYVAKKGIEKYREKKQLKENEKAAKKASKK